MRALALAAAVLLGCWDPAFAAAWKDCEGFGCETPGGRGGRVLFVTSTADSGAGTLREALEADGPRIVIPRVAGTVTLTRPIVVAHPFLTVSGQAAPGSGLALRHITTSEAGQAADSFTSLDIRTSDVVIRGLVIRPGIWPEDPRCTGKNAIAHQYGSCVDAGDVQAVSISAESRRVVLDSMTFARGTDELLDIAGQDVTVSWSIIADGFRTYPYCGFWTRCPKYRGMGVIVGDLARPDATRLSTHHNLWADLMARAPQVVALMDVRANLVFNWQDYAANVHNLQGETRANVVDNRFVPGTDTPLGASQRALTVNDWGDHALATHPGSPLGLYAVRNDGVTPGACAKWSNAKGAWEACPPGYLLAEPAEAPPVTVETDWEALVLARAGASWRVDALGVRRDRRDEEDRRVVAGVAERTGKAPSHRDKLAWPAAVVRGAWADQDRDGLSDEWERERGLKLSVPDGHLDPDGDGFTRLDDFLSGTGG